MYSFNGGADDSNFTIDGDKLKIKTSLDYETKSSYSIKLKATDRGGLVATKDIMITINYMMKPFVMKIKDTNFLYNFTIPTKSDLTYNYDIDCDYDGTFDATATAQTEDYTCRYGVEGEHIVAIVGDFPAIYFNNAGDHRKLQQIQAWGEIEWSSMERAFYGAENMTMTATDKPDLRNVTNMYAMFNKAENFNGFIGDWNVSNVTSMGFMFSGARVFNQDISNWDVSNVTDRCCFNTDSSLQDNFMPNF